MVSRGQSALEYLLLIAGAVLVSVVILLIALSSYEGGGNILGNNIGSYQNTIVLNPINGGQGPGNDTTPPVISFTVVPGDFSLTVQYSVTDDVGVSTISLLKTDEQSFWNTFKNTISAYTSPPNGMVHSILFSGSGNPVQSGSFVDEAVRNGVPYYYGISACDTSNNCGVWYMSPAHTGIPGSLEYAIPVGPTMNISFNPLIETIFHGDDDSPYPLGSDNCVVDNRDPIQDAPDYPVRAFKNDLGEIIVYAGAGDNYIWALNNNDWSAANFVADGTRQCAAPALKWRFDYDNAGAYTGYPYSDKQWMSSPYTLDGRTVYALVHDEYNEGAGNPSSFCWQGPPTTTCTLMSDTLVVSTDSGHTFSDASFSPRGATGQGYPAEMPGNVVATTPYAYEAGVSPVDVQGNPTAFGSTQPSNIIKQGNYYYSLFNTTFKGGLWSQSGVCIGRTANIADPTSWEFFQWGVSTNANVRGPTTDQGNTYPSHSGLLIGPRTTWNLDSFFTADTYPLVMDPSNNDPSRECGFIAKYPVTVWPISASSLTYNTYLGKYLAIYSIPKSLDCAFYFSVSPDLIHWSKPQLLRDHETVGNYLPDCSTNGTHATPTYVSLIDRDSAGLNYEYSDASSDIYWISHRYPSDHFADIDVMRQELTFSCPQGC